MNYKIPLQLHKYNEHRTLAMDKFFNISVSPFVPK